MRKMQPIVRTKFILLTLFSLTASVIAMAQVGHVKGFIRTSDGQPAQYVSIELKEVKGGVLSSEDGAYLLRNINEGKYTLLVSFVGLSHSPVILRFGKEKLLPFQ